MQAFCAAPTALLIFKAIPALTRWANHWSRLRR